MISYRPRVYTRTRYEYHPPGLAHCSEHCRRRYPHTHSDLICSLTTFLFFQEKVNFAGRRRVLSKVKFINFPENPICNSQWCSFNCRVRSIRVEKGYRSRTRWNFGHRGNAGILLRRGKGRLGHDFSLVKDRPSVMRVMFLFCFAFSL